MEENEKEDNDIMEEQINMWNEGSSIENMDESRYGANTTSNNPKIIKDVSIILNRVASKSERLIGNFTTNLAPCWMHIRTKFDEEKCIIIVIEHLGTQDAMQEL